MNIGIIEKNEDIAYHLKDIISEKCPHCQLKIWKNINDLKAEIREGIVYKILFVSVDEHDTDVIEYMSRLQALRNDLWQSATRAIPASGQSIHHLLGDV